MDASRQQLVGQVEELERRLRRLQHIVVGSVLLCAAAVAAACTTVNAEARAAGDGILRARGLVITDARGNERIHIGAPVPDDPGGARPRISEATGMIILDENGHERFGIGHRADDETVIGFDAPPGTGSGSNRERLHLGVDAQGRGFVRFLDRTSALAGRLHLTGEDKVALEFWQGHLPTRTFRRSVIDLEGWRRLPTIRSPRRPANGDWP